MPSRPDGSGPGGAGSDWGRIGIIADIKYRYFKWRMARLRKRFDVYQGRDEQDWNDYPRGTGRNWDDRVH